MISIRFVCAACALAACAGAPPERQPTAAEELASWLVGAWSNHAQAEADPDYLDVRMTVTPIWPERGDGPWLYVEHAAVSAPVRPYRQRVHRLRNLAADEVRSDVFELPQGEVLALAGASNDPGRFDGLTADDLVPQDGCSMFLARGDKRFRGGTRGQGCADTLRGAVYAITEIEIGPERVTRTDRGFDASGRQVWGPIGDAYVFERIEVE